MDGSQSQLQLFCFTKRSSEDEELKSLLTVRCCRSDLPSKYSKAFGGVRQTRGDLQTPLKGPAMQLVRCDISQRLGLSFDASAYFGALRTQILGQVLLAAEVVPSTQSIVQDNIAALPNGTLCTATRQVAGKGALPSSPPATNTALQSGHLI